MADEENKENSEDDLMPEAPDGGWGWLVVIAAFCCNFILDGIVFSFGVFLNEIAHAFNVSKGSTSWVGSLLAGCYLSVGPLVSLLINTYGCRIVCIVGSVIATAAFVLGYFATDLVFLCVTLGIIGGIGYGFIYLPALVTVAIYFKSKRALATGLAVCGSGIGTFVMPPLVEFLIEYFDWRGALLILGGITLNCAVFGCLFRPLEPPKKIENEKKLKPLLLRIKEVRDADLKACESRKGSVCLSAADLANSTEFPKAAANSQNSTTSSQETPPPSYNDVVSGQIPTYSVEKELDQNDQLKSPPWTIPEKNLNRPFYRPSILYSASDLLKTDKFDRKGSFFGSFDRISNINAMAVSGKSLQSQWSEKPQQNWKEMLDLSLLKSPTFLTLAIAGFLTLAGFFVPFIYLVDRAVLSGVPRTKATFILSVIGITNTVGRVFSGWISDRPNVSALVVNNCALTVGGLVTMLSPFLHSYELLQTYGAVFGFSIACFAALRSVIVTELMGVHKLTSALGLLLLFQGIASIIGSPIAGFFFDVTGSYDSSFFIAGAFIMLSGIMCFPLPWIARWEERRNELRASKSDNNDSIDNDVSLAEDSKV